ncbi:phylloplanin-like [Momordica charantia]|uniref:Phylloplanin-like n=1 Tax=Momordica charantia TaxID=3673 RepID=A0A6J1C7T1_MOMCH|nr:phylloplanin-like [Momordica charantia]
MGLRSVLLVLVMAAAVGAPLMVEAQLGIIGSLLGLIRIQGTVFCTANGNIGINGTATPVFPNAAVQMECGDGNVVSSVTTNNMGIFSILLDPLQFILSSVLNNCNVVVKTPLSNCNASLPSTGSLLSRLQFVSKKLQGLLSIVNLVPSGFQLL